MIQLTEEQRERVKQIRDRFGTSRATWQDVGFLLSLLDSDSQAAEPDYRPETMNAEKDKATAREIIGNVNNYAEDDGELSVSAFGPLSKRIASALATARKEAREAVWKKVIGIVEAVYRNTMGSVSDWQVLGPLEAAMKKDIKAATTDTDKTERG